MRNVAALAAFACLCASPVFAQTGPSVTLQPQNPRRWDAAFQFGWRGVDRSDTAPEWNSWYDVGSVGGSVGYYLTAHVKVDLDIAGTSQGRVYSYPVSPVARPQQDEFRATTFNGTVSYQFFDNTWFHPFVGAGFDVVRESARVRLPQYIFWPAPSAPIVPVPEQVSDWDSFVTVHPATTAGFKWYVTERAFVRSDVRWAFSSKRAESFTWRGGVGFDF